MTAHPNLDRQLAGSRDRLRRAALALAWATVAWNIVEAVVAVAAGHAAGSVALVSFGLDSTIEVASAAVIIWQFSGLDEKRERLALRLIGVSFFLLAAYVGGRAALDLLTATEPESSPIGFALASASLVVMPVLAAGKARIGRRLGSSTVSADSRQTWLCTYLSAVLLAGLLLNSLWGWWWADPLAGLVIAGLALREGLEAWNGDSCCD